MGKSRAVIIGGGLGGLSAAVSLASRGWKVTVAEKNSHLGGKLNVCKKDGFNFDLGPSLLTMPHIFYSLFNRAGKDPKKYFEFKQVNPQWRNFFPDGSQIDLFQQTDSTAKILNKLYPGSAEQFNKFLNYANKQRNLIESLYFKRGIDSVWDLLLKSNPIEVLQVDMYTSVSGSLEKHIKDKHLQQILGYFCKYVGSSPYRAPAFLNALCSIQFAFGAYYIKGGMYKLAEALGKLLLEQGVDIKTGYEATGIKTGWGNTIEGVHFRDRETLPCDIVVSNMETIPFYIRVAGLTTHAHALERRFPPSCSGLVIHLGVNKNYPWLAHHNIFHSQSPKKQFRSVFERFTLPDDPILYVVAPDQPGLAPKGCSVIKVLPQIPSLYSKSGVTCEGLKKLRSAVLGKLQRMGLEDLENHIVTEKTLSPYDLKSLYNSHRGAIYGTVSDRWKNMGFKAPQKSTIFSNLYFAGGSVNPGCGMPMVVLGGMQVADRIGFAR
ncbi:phytoene desaturase [Chitinispirillum alkaliphilum]|nr:phytoene desaturase [Chitinispirillum alkaliphilum]